MAPVVVWTKKSLPVKISSISNYYPQLRTILIFSEIKIILIARLFPVKLWKKCKKFPQNDSIIIKFEHIQGFHAFELWIKTIKNYPLIINCILTYE